VVIFCAKPFHQTGRGQEFMQWSICARDPQVDAKSFQVSIQILQCFCRRRIEITDGFRIKIDA
jgi:hypothetical protein